MRNRSLHNASHLASTQEMFPEVVRCQMSNTGKIIRAQKYRRRNRGGKGNVKHEGGKASAGT